jgi:YCII-related domain-containing protein
MSTFVFAHRAPSDYVGSANAAAAWNAWFEQLNDHLVDRGNPVFSRQAVGHTGGETVLGGYTVISADTLADAVTLAEGCPIVAAGGGIEVGEITVSNAGRHARV